MSAAWGPDKSYAWGAAVSRERKWESSTLGLALRNDAASACTTLSPWPQHKLDPAKQVTVASAGDKWLLTGKRNLPPLSKAALKVRTKLLMMWNNKNSSVVEHCTAHQEVSKSNVDGPSDRYFCYFPNHKQMIVQLWCGMGAELVCRWVLILIFIYYFSCWSLVCN